MSVSERRRSGLAAGLSCLVVLAGACGLLPDSDACPETIEDGGSVDGIDLARPEWLGEDFPLPASLSIRHLAVAADPGGRFLTGFVPGGSPDAVVGVFSSGLEPAGFDVLLEADGFVPVASDAIVAVDDESGILASIGVGAARLGARNSDGSCPPVDGAQVSIRFEPVDPTEARGTHAGSSITRGAAVARIEGAEYSAPGECRIVGGRRTFVSTSVDMISLDFDASAGSASVAVGDVSYLLDPDATAAGVPSFAAHTDGFGVSGPFRDAVGDAGLVTGTIDVTCR